MKTIENIYECLPDPVCTALKVLCVAGATVAFVALSVAFLCLGAEFGLAL